MGLILRKLALGLILIALAASILLLSDLRSRIDAAATEQTDTEFSVAIIQNASHPILDDGVRGLIDGLAEGGFQRDQNLRVREYNAEGDMATLNTIATDAANGDYDMLLSVSTPGLQAVANANQRVQKNHVFALVTDPWSAGVGITGDQAQDHPPYLAGYGTMQPVRQSFEMARQMNPSLKTVGVVYNAAEQNSVAQIELARQVCQDLGIELLENTADNSANVAEAGRALISRGVEALWLLGDSTILVASDALIDDAMAAQIPAFSVIPPTVEKGALFDIGANYYQTGLKAGELAAEILAGREPASVPITNYVPELIAINLDTARALPSQWRVPEALIEKADLVIDSTGKAAKSLPTPTPTPTPQESTASKPANIHVVAYIQAVDVEECEAGIRKGFEESELEEGRDYTLTYQNAHGDVATVSSMIDAAVTDGADMIMTLSTPTLQAALRRAGEIPVVFTYCASGVAAGAGTSDTDHRPTVTGVQNQGAYDEILKVMLEVVPDAKTVGTLFVPSEVNTVFHKDNLAASAEKLGLELIAIPADTSAEVPDAARALCQRDIQAICQIPGNLTVAAFPGILRAAELAGMPLFTTQSAQALAGSPVTVARDYYESGIEAAKVAVRILQGEDPADIPFSTFGDTKIILNETAIQKFGLTIPPSLRAQATEIIH